MNTCIAILRGINVSGRNLVKMEILRGMFHALGFANVQTYIQSGNVIFQSEQSNPYELSNKIASEMAETFGFEVPVIVKMKDELIETIGNNPFLKDTEKAISALHATFLSDRPDPEKIGSILHNHFQPDEFELIDKTIYLYCPNGYGQTKLTNNFFESRLKVVATTRNWRTTCELLQMAQKLQIQSS